MKITIMGFSGSGKSTLARELGQELSLPVLHFDAIHFLPGWVETSREEKREKVRAFLEMHPSGWVIDGNYLQICPEMRFPVSDVILFLDFPRWLCLLRVLRRWSKNRGKTRPDMAPGCPEKLDWEFVRWVLWDGRRQSRRKTMLEVGQQNPKAWVRLTSPRALRKWKQDFYHLELAEAETERKENRA